MSVTTVTANRPTTATAAARRTELAAFLRASRERISPEDVGLPPGSRRRTAGLRREELAQLAGVGVTWYTWLEQGRPINASVQVLDAVATTLRLDQVERAHLFRLADLPGAAAAAADCGECPLPPEVQLILDAIKFPACVLSERFDLIAWNEMYAALFPGDYRGSARRAQHPAVNLTSPSCCSPLPDRTSTRHGLVGQLRAAYGSHVGDPAWTHFIRRLEARQPGIRRSLGRPRRGQPTSHTKRFRHPTVGTSPPRRPASRSTAVPGARLVVYTPDDEPSEKALARLAEGADRDARFPCWNTHHPERANSLFSVLTSVNQ